jgi:soluble P-type ATPase
MEGLVVPAPMRRAMEEAHGEGHSHRWWRRRPGRRRHRASSSYRPEVREMVAGLRQRGVDHLAIISGDHEGPTRKLAELLGMDRYFAEVLPADKANYVELLQKEGRTVCFVGDGINDSIALKKAEVSISLRGASTIATDTAQIVFMMSGSCASSIPDTPDPRATCAEAGVILRLNVASRGVCVRRHHLMLLTNVVTVRAGQWPLALSPRCSGARCRTRSRPAKGR